MKTLGKIILGLGIVGAGISVYLFLKKKKTTVESPYGTGSEVTTSGVSTTTNTGKTRVKSGIAGVVSPITGGILLTYSGYGISLINDIKIGDEIILDIGSNKVKGTVYEKSSTTVTLTGATVSTTYKNINYNIYR